jgi:adenylate cyclase
METETPSPPPTGLLERLRLRFADPAVEQAFRRDHRKDGVAVMRWGAVVAALMALMFMWQDNEISSVGFRATNIRIYLILPLCAATWFALGLERAERAVEWIAAAFLLAYAALVGAICLVFEPGFYGVSGAVAEGNFLMIVLATFTMAHLRSSVAAAVGAGVLAIYLAMNRFFTEADFALFLYGNFSNMVMAFVLGATACTMLERLRRRQYLTRQDLAAEKERYKSLLFTLVPSQIALRIEHGEFPIADSQAETAILFSDFVGFTQLTKQIAPRTLIQLLNELFFEFDLAAERHGVEKIKTIGDGYMAACGPPVHEDKRTLAMARFGLELVTITRRTAARFNLPISIRVGIHTGNLIAGVIGKNRYTFDMWGESVNMASRMESSGMADRVQVSESAYQRLAGQFEFEPRGAIEVKGLGSVQAYLLRGPGHEPYLRAAEVQERIADQS